MKLHNSETLVERLHKAADETVARLEAVMSGFENSLRSSKEVTPLSLLTDDDWYSQDELYGNNELYGNKIMSRGRSFLSCVCLVGLYLARFPFQVPQGISEFVEAVKEGVEGLRNDVRIASEKLRKVAQQGGRLKDNKRIRSAKLARPPGTLLLKVGDFFFSKKTVTLTLRPLVADWQGEYFEALNEKRYLKARFISIRYYWAFAKACGLSRAIDLLGKITLALPRQ